LPEIRCIFLDLGRVLINLDLTFFGNRMKQLAGVQPEELRAAILDNGLGSSFETGRISEAEFHAQICGTLGKKISFDDFFAAWNSIFLPAPLLPDRLISRLAQKARLWTLSNTNIAHFNFIREHFPSLRYFEGRILSYEVGLQKPDERIFHLALDRAKVEAEATLFIDDQLQNVEAARALGIDAFQFIDRDQFAHEMRTRNLLSNDKRQMTSDK
jgi:putative hydrolase of the HAD superfamily